MSNEVGRNIWYSSLGNILPAIFTSIFWFVAARLAGSEVIGIASAIASFVAIITTVNNLNTSYGMKRYLGIAYSSKDFSEFKQILASAIFLASILVLGSVLVISLPQLRLLEIIGIGQQNLLIILAMIVSMVYQQIFSEALISALKAKSTVIPLLLGSLARFPVLVLFINVYSAPMEGTIIGYASLLFVSSIMYLISLIRLLNVRTVIPSIKGLKTNTMVVLKASLSGWVPRILGMLGSQLGVLAVFSVAGATEGGKFYVPFAIYSVTLFIVSGITRVSQSLIAGMREENKQTAYTSYILKLAFIFTIPLAFPLLFFSKNFLALMGEEFSDSSFILTLFIISLPFTIISEIVYYFAYGKGMHKSVLWLGLSGNIPRTLLYFVLTPLLGGVGAALAFLIGSLCQTTASVIIGRKYILFSYKQYFIITIIPVLIGSATWYIGLHYIISSTLIILGSIVVYVRIHLLQDAELRSVVYSIFPSRSAERVYSVLSHAMRRIN